MGKWIETFGLASSSKLKLFCFPFAGGNSTTFRKLAEMVTTDYEVCAVELPGRLGRISEQPIGELHLLVNSIYSAIRPQLADGGATFLGYSFGSLVAFELARLLKKRDNIDLKEFIVLSYRGPSAEPLNPPLHQLPMREFLLSIQQRYGFVQKMLLESEDLQKMVEPALRADFSVFENYRYQHAKPLNCPITVISGSEDKSLELEALEKWRNETSSRFELKQVQAGHFLLAGNETLASQILKSKSKI